MDMKVYNLAGEVVGAEQVEIESLGPVNKKVLYYAVNAYLANQRQGNAAAKTRSQVSGGGKKPWKQKGTGRARVGSSRSPLWRGGAVVFGPQPRDYRIELPVTVRRKALGEALKDKLIGDRVILLSDYLAAEPKTRVVSGWLKKTALSGKILFFLPSEAGSIRRSGRNIPGVMFADPAAPDLYGILNADYLVVGQNCWDGLARRLRPAARKLRLQAGDGEAQ